MGLRPGEEPQTDRLLRSLRFYPIDWEVAQLAGDLYRQYRKQGQTLGFADMTIAAVAIVHDLVLVTRNHKHFPMPDLKLLPL